MNAAPSITVLMPVYNAAPFLREAVESVLVQTHVDLELLVVNDGSTDESGIILGEYTDSRIRVVDNAKNLGLIASLNIGLGNARGRYMARMDGDDIMHPDRLRQLFELLEGQPGIAAAATGVQFIDAHGRITGTWDRDQATPTEETVAGMLPKTNCIASIMVRTAIVRDLGYAKRQVGVEDWDLLLRMRSRGLRIAKIPKPLYNYRIHTGSIMGVSKKKASSEVRLLRARHRFLLGEWKRLRFNTLHVRVLYAQARSVARHLKVSVLPPLISDSYRLFTYSPLAVLREERALRKALSEWNGHHLFCFPYMCVGGAEQIHVDILASVSDRGPLVLICGSSADRSFEDRFRMSATVVEVWRLVNHPFTRQRAVRRIAMALNAASSPTLLASLNNTFFEVLPLLRPNVRTFHLQHAFLYQPNANAPQRGWMHAFPRVDRFIFYSSQAMGDWQRFMTANGIAYDPGSRFLFLSNAVHRTHAPERHEPMGVLFVGRQSPVKRIELFLAITDALEQARPGLFRFSVAGYDAVGQHPHVTFHGKVRDPQRLSDLYRAHDVVVQTSTLEGFPMVIMEAMAHGLAVLSTPVGDVPNRVTMDFAFLSSSVDEAVVLREMTKALLDLGTDRPRLEHMRAAAFAKAKEEYGWDAFRDRYRAALISPAASTSAINR